MTVKTGPKQTQPANMNVYKRKITLTRCRALAERLVAWHRDGFEQYVRAHRELYGYDPDTEEVSHTWPEDILDEER